MDDDDVVVFPCAALTLVCAVEIIKDTWKREEKEKAKDLDERVASRKRFERSLC